MRILHQPTCIPVMPYFGGKTLLAKWVNDHLPRSASAYVEGFAGSAAVGLSRPRAAIEVFNDLDPGVVNLYRVLQTQPDALRERLHYTLHSRREHTLCAAAENERAAGTAATDPVEWARQYLVLVRQSYAGIFKSSWAYSRSSRGISFHRVLNLLAPVADRLRHATLENLHVRDLICRYDAMGPDTLWYLDPPYVPDARVSNRVYCKEMTTREHELLLEQVCAISGMVVLSGYPSDLYDDALQGWLRVTRGVACLAAGGSTRFGTGIKPRRTECLWINPAAQERLRRERRLAA